ncbi:MAG: CAP domain-containing protein [Rhizobiales bacterium]|nr:CAP domain-containing protein [Hyphomicrobiales bacterium]
MMKRAVFVFAVVNLAWVSPALALDLNSFRAQHGRPALAASATLSGAALSHARDLANRKRLDHAGFRQRANFTGGTAAENVAFGCDSEDCVIKMWARSGGHRANMLRRDVTSYGLASATADNGRRYWVLELGN